MKWKAGTTIAFGALSTTRSCWAPSLKSFVEDDHVINLTLRSGTKYNHVTLHEAFCDKVRAELGVPRPDFVYDDQGTIIGDATRVQVSAPATPDE